MNKETDYCKECGGFIEWDKSSQLMTSPTKYKGECKSCGEIHYEFCYKVNKDEESCKKQ